MRKKQILEYLKTKVMATTRDVAIAIDMDYNNCKDILMELYFQGKIMAVDVHEYWPHSRKPSLVRYWFLPQNKDKVKEFLERQSDMKVIRWYIHEDKIPSLY